MSGFECARIACSVTAGTWLRCVKRIESPERAAQAAAGIAYGACSPDATITCGLGLPLIAVKKRSIAAAVAYGSAPPTRIVLRVATVGKPSFAAAWLWDAVGAVVATPPPPATSLPPLPIEQPARAIVSRMAALRIGAGP